MKRAALFALLLMALGCGSVHVAVEQDVTDAPIPRKAKTPIERVVFVLFENENPENLPTGGFFSRIAAEGSTLEDCHGVARPSQPNYFALTAGDTFGASNSNVTLDVPHVGKLLAERGMTYRCYAEGYPGGCFLEARSGLYARKHAPFISYADVTSDPARCEKIVVPIERFFEDARAGTLPTYSFVVPDLVNSGHDKGLQVADDWAQRRVGPLLNDAKFTEGTLLVVTFDEGRINDDRNHFFCGFWGEMVRPGVTIPGRKTHYDILRTVEEIFGLPTMTPNDAAAKPIEGIFRD